MTSMLIFLSGALLGTCIGAVLAAIMFAAKD